MKSQHTRSTSKKSCPTFLQPKSLSSSIFKQQSQPHILKSCDDSPFTKLQPDLSYDIPLTSFNTFSLPPFKLSTTHLTFNGVPLIVHDVMNFIIAGLDSNIDWFEDKPLAVIEDLPSLPDVEEDVLFHMVSEVNETLSVVDLKAFGFSYNQALQIKELCKQEDKTCFFQRLDLNENNTNKELADAFNVISEFNITNKLEFSCRNPIKIAFLLLKLYFLSQPEPLLPPSFTLVIETIVASPLSTKTDSQTALLEAIKRLPSTSRPILKEVLSFLKNLVNITMMPSSEIVSLYSCYINAMSHRHWLGKEHLLLISDSSLCATQNTVDLRSGERIIEKIPDVVCPLFFLPVGCTDIPKESVSGTLYFTTHRIVFVSDNPLASHQIDALKVLGETDIHNIHGIHITDPNENCGSRDVKPSVSEKLIPISLTPNINTGSLKLSASTPQGLSSTKSPKSKPTKSFSKSKRKSGSCVTSYTASAPISPLCNSHILRILCSDIRQLTFFINGNLIDYNALLTTIQSTYTPINESILSHDINQEYSIKKLLVSESKRLHCVDSLHSIFNPYSTSKIEIVKEELPDTVILYQTFTGNKLLCFTGDSFDIQLSSQFLSTLSKKVMIIPCHTQTVSKAMALFISIQHAFISTNKEIDGDFMIKYRDDVTHLGECADNMLHSILSCVGNLLHSSKHIIIATEENNSVLCVYSFIIQILIDPYYRSISGFISLFQLCFVAFQYKFTAQPIHFILALIIIERVIMENITQFQYDVRLLEFIFSSLFTGRFYEFTSVGSNSFIHYITTHRQDFLNSCYSSSPNELSLTNILPRLTSLFDRWTLYTQYNISAVISLSEHEIKEQFCTISTMNLTLFPCSTNLGMLTKLTYLDLSNNCFTELPLQVCRLPQLKFLSLNKNNVHHISDQISKLSNLSLLDVANNSLKTLPSFIRVPLISIDISYNPLLSPLKISFNSKLESFTGIGLKEYPFGLSTFENLRTLDLSHTKFDIKPIVTHPPPNLSSLTLRYCKITTLPESFTQLNITYLDISHNHISRFHYSFFSMQTLCELNISYNRLPIISSMFDMMENLTTLESQPQTHQEIYTHLCSLETVIVTGGSYRNEVFSKLIQRLPQYGTVKDITTDSFTLSLPNIDNVKIVNYPVSYLEDLRWTFHRTLFIVCGSNEYDKELKCALLHIQSLHASLQTHVVYSSYSNSTSNSTLEKNSSSQDKQQTSKKSKKEQKKEQKKLKNQLTQNAASKHVCGSGCGECNHFYSKLCKQVSECAAPSPTTCKAVLNELAALHIPHYVLSPQTLEDILLCLRSSTDVLSWLLDAGYLLQTPPSSTLYEQTPPWDNPTYILVDFSIFLNTQKVLKKKIYFKDGWFSQQILEIVGVPENPASFILRLMHHYDIIFIYRRSAAIRLNLKQQFDDMNRQLENVGEIPESMASSLSSSSVSSSSSRQSSKSYLTLTNNTDILIYPSSNLNEMRNDSDWPLSHDNDEVEHGRIYNINGLSRELASLINSTFCLKYRYQKQWKNGVIVTCESGNSNERIYMMVEEDLSNQQITLRMRYLITNVMICFSATKLIQEVEDLLSRITHLEGSSISRVLFICPEKILKGEIETVSEDVILTAIKHNQIELHTSTLHYNLVLCALDRIMTSLNQTKQINIEDFTFIKGITEGSNSQVSLYRCEKDFGEIQKGQEVVIKTATFELFSGFDDKSIAKIELFKRFVGEYLREFSFIEFSPNSALAKVFGYSFSPLCVVMEYCGGGDLFTFLHISTHKFTLKEMLSIAKQVAKALQLLHTSTPPIIHRDLKSPNILLRGVLSENSKKGSKILGDNLNFSNCAVTDFGMSVSGNEIGSPVECPYWLAPECISHSNFSPASDIYAFAIVLWELQSREPPFQKLKFFSEVRDHVLAGGRLPLIDNDKLLPYNSLIRSCWNHNPSLRPSSTQVLNELDNMLKLL